MCFGMPFLRMPDDAAQWMDWICYVNARQNPSQGKTPTMCGYHREVYG